MGLPVMALKHEESADGRIEEDCPCASCGYNLRELPRTHRCPECGFEYDPKAVLIPLRGKRFCGADAYAMIALVGGPIVLAVAVFGSVQMRSWLFDDTSTGRLILKSAQCTTFAVIGLFALIRIWKRLGRKQELRINRKGVQFIDPSLPRGLIPWERIASAGCVDDSEALVINGSSGETIVSCARELIGQRSDVELCARQINALRDKYRDLN